MRSARAISVAILAAILGLGACTTGTAPDAGASNAMSFSNATSITNPYLPLSQGGRWIYEGTSAGEPSLVEVAVMPSSTVVEWGGTSTETLTIRRRVWVNGVLREETIEHHAQSDDGGVWSFGHAVTRFDPDGVFLDREGSWLAGVDGAAPALIVPGEPRVGQSIGSEEPGGSGEIVSLTETVETPEGSVDTGLQVDTAGTDQTVYAPDVGEVLSRNAEGELRLVERLPDGAESAERSTFSSPTVVDNPYFGVTGVDYRLYFGKDEGEPLRIEVAPTGETKAIDWSGGSTDTTVSQFIATSDRSLLEIAVDWFAQDDAGNVWYFGENVWNYEEGRVANMDGTWIAGADGPPGMIMPGEPSVGQRFNPENIPGSVFETVDVQSLDESYPLPAGPRASDVLVLHETLNDGVEETKFYVAGYGNVNVRIPGVEAVDIVYALPKDAIDAPRPRELDTMLGGLRALSTRGTGDVAAMRRAFDRFLARTEAVPEILLKRAGSQLAQLGQADRIEARASAMDVEQTVLDIARLYRSDRPVDLEVLDLLARRMLAAVDAHDLVGATTAAALAAGVADRNATTLSTRVAETAVAGDGAGGLQGIAAAARDLRAALA